MEVALVGELAHALLSSSERVCIAYGAFIFNMNVILNWSGLWYELMQGSGGSLL